MLFWRAYIMIDDARARNMHVEMSPVREPSWPTRLPRARTSHASSRTKWPRFYDATSFSSGDATRKQSRPLVISLKARCCGRQEEMSARATMTTQDSFRQHDAAAHRHAAGRVTGAWASSRPRRAFQSGEWPERD